WHALASNLRQHLVAGPLNARESAGDRKLAPRIYGWHRVAGRQFDKPIARLKGTSHYTLTDKDLVNVCWVIQPTSPTTVYIASLPDDIRVIGASNHDGNKTDTRSVVATQRIRRQVPIFRMPAIRAVTTRFRRLDRCERRNCNCDERNNCRR